MTDDRMALLDLVEKQADGDLVREMLAEIKPTFHNVLAHPLWLHDPAEAAARYPMRLRLQPGWIEVDTACTPNPHPPRPAAREGRGAVAALACDAGGAGGCCRPTGGG